MAFIYWKLSQTWGRAFKQLFIGCWQSMGSIILNQSWTLISRDGKNPTMVFQGIILNTSFTKKHFGQVKIWDLKLSFLTTIAAVYTKNEWSYKSMIKNFGIDWFNFLMVRHALILFKNCVTFFNIFQKKCTYLKATCTNLSKMFGYT